MAPAAGGVDMDPEEVEEIRRYFPNRTTGLRACIGCRQIMTKDQFVDYGCPNCKDILGMQGSEGRVVACTSANFQGYISLIRPGAFLSRFNGLEHKKPGCYALTVQGSIPEHITHESEMERELEERKDRSTPSERTLSKKGSLIGSEASEAEPSPRAVVTAAPAPAPTPAATPGPEAGLPETPAAALSAAASTPAGLSSVATPTPAGLTPGGGTPGGVTPAGVITPARSVSGTPAGMAPQTPAELIAAALAGEKHAPSEASGASAHEPSPKRARSVASASGASGEEGIGGQEDFDLDNILEPEADGEFGGPAL